MVGALLAPTFGLAQSTFHIDGRVEFMPTVWDNGDALLTPLGFPEGKVYSTYLINNRINLEYNPWEWLQLNAGIRNMASYGNQHYEFNAFYERMGMDYYGQFSNDPGKMPLTAMWHQGPKGYTSTNLDRLNAKLTFGSLEITLGRQRINWGINGIWEPNDIFNTFSYLNFNYPERPGADAVRVQYYLGATSSLDAAFKLDRENRKTYAAMYKTTVGMYDLQVMGGVLNDTYATMGGGWSGTIGGAGFSGEFSYYLPMEGEDDLEDAFLISLAANYNFPNMIFLQGGVLVNSAGSSDKSGSTSLIRDPSMPITALDYTNSIMQVFTAVSYPVTPLFTADLALLINPFDGSLYIGPSMNYSLAQNLDIFFIAQTYFGPEGSEFGDLGQQYSLRLKYSF